MHTYLCDKYLYMVYIMYHINKHIHMHTHMEERWDTIYMNFRKSPLDVMDKTDGHWQQLNLVTQKSWVQMDVQDGATSTKECSGTPRSLDIPICSRCSLGHSFL